MNSFDLKIDPKDRFYGRFASNVLGALKEAIQRRNEEGLSNQAIADKLGIHKSSLSRVLNGRVKNITLRTASDIFYACDAEPRQLQLDFMEDVCPNSLPDHLTIKYRMPIIETVSDSSFKTQGGSENVSSTNKPFSRVSVGA